MTSKAGAAPSIPSDPSGADMPMPEALRIVAMSIERAPRAMMLLDPQWRIRVANREARIHHQMAAGQILTDRVSRSTSRLVHGLTQAITTSRGVPLRLTFGEDQIVFQAWRIDPLPGLTEAMVMLKADPANLFVAQINSLARARDHYQRRLTHTEEERDALRHAASMMTRLALTDHLTGLHNLHSFRQVGEKLLADKMAPVAVIYADLNGFKAVNDHFGHEAGDHVLREVAWRLSGTLRDEDTLARLGGDEFAVWLPNATPDVAARRMEDLRKSLTPPIFWSAADGSTALLRQIQAAFGYATAPEDGADIDSLLRVADHRMYADKSGMGPAGLRQSG